MQSQSCTVSPCHHLWIISPSLSSLWGQTDENQREPDVEYRLGGQELQNLVFVGVVIVWAALNTCLLIAWICMLHKPCVNPRLSYTIEYTDPWLTFDSCAVSVIFIHVLSGFFKFLGACWCWVASWWPSISYTVCPFLNVYIHAPMHMHFSGKECCSHSEHINMVIYALCTPAHKTCNTDFVFPWCKLKVAQPCSMLNSNSHTHKHSEQVQDHQGADVSHNQ